MWNTPCSKRGFGMIETVMAICLTAIGVAALLSLIPTSWKTSATSDDHTRASEILHERLENIESLIMNPCNIAPLALTTIGPVQRYSSGNATALTGDRPYTVSGSINVIAANQWQIQLRVTWAGNAVGVMASRTVTRQDDYKYPAACVLGSVDVSGKYL